MYVQKQSKKKKKKSKKDFYSDVCIVGILFRLLEPFAENRCQSLQLVPTREHSDMRYLLMSDEPGSKFILGKRNKSIFIITMRQIIARKLM